MPEQLFTTEVTQIAFLVPAPTADQTSLSLNFEIRPPADYKPGSQIRLCHVRLADVTKKLPKYSEVFELKVSANGALVVELSGYGNKQKQFVAPLKLGGLADDHNYQIVYDPHSGEVAVNGDTAKTHIKSEDRPLQILFGFDLAGKKLVPPIGWMLRWEGDSPASWSEAEEEAEE